MDPIFENPVITIPGNLEIPLVIHRLGTQSSDRGELDCQIATYLHIEPQTGFAPPEWQSHIGTCIVARKDKKPLSVEHMEGVWMFIDYLIGYYEDGDPKAASKHINRKEYEEWLEAYKEGCVSDGRDEWKAICPNLFLKISSRSQNSHVVLPDFLASLHRCGS